MAGRGMYGTPPSSLRLKLRGFPSDSQDLSTFFNQLFHNHNSSAGFFSSEDPNRFAPLLPLVNHSGSDYDAVVGSSSTFHFSDPYAYVPAQAHAKEATQNELFSAVFDDFDDSNTNTSFKQHSISPHNNPTDFTSPLEKNAEASELPSKPVPPRTSSKRSRAAEFHNLSEKRRRSRINEKMKALQNLIPNSNKTDKASMLDEAIEYLKQLQVQVQMLMMRNGLSLHPMSFPGGLQPMILPQTGLDFDEGNGFQKTTSGIASSANAECLVRPAFSFPKHCSISNQSVVIPSMANITTSDTSSSFQPSVKDALCGSMPQLLLDTTKIGKNPSPDVS